MTTSLAVLIVEDSESDGQLIVRALKKAGYDVVVERVETAEQMRAAWEKRAWDIVISDYSLPQFDGRAALTFLRETGRDIPFIVVSGTIGEETAVAMMKAGAHDYLLKGNLARLTPAVERELAQAEARQERTRAEAALWQSEARFRGVLEAAPDAVLLVNNERHSILFANAQAERQFGYRRDELLGQSIELLVPERFRERHVQFRTTQDMGLIARPMGTGRELAGRRKDGSEFFADIMLGPLESDGEVVVLTIVRDITERKRAEEALVAKNEEIKVMTQQLWHAAKLATMGELAASIAHELNNPLGTVSLRVESLLSQIPPGGSMRRELEVVEQEAERMGALVAHLLHFSRRGAPQISTVNVGEEIENTLELIHYHLRQRQITIQREFAPGVPMVPADRQQLRQLFLNLFTNAADAMPEGGVLTIRVGREAWASEGMGEVPARPRPHTPTQVFIEVADTGTGIAPEDLPRVTEPFFTTKPEGKGTGLGLAICRRIVQEHDGTFEITSPGPGQGTTVRLTLPAKNDSHEFFLEED